MIGAVLSISLITDFGSVDRTFPDWLTNTFFIERLTKYRPVLATCHTPLKIERKNPFPDSVVI
jgi:hypothetical protein